MEPLKKKGRPPKGPTHAEGSPTTTSSAERSAVSLTALVASQQVSWWSVHEHVAPLLDQIESWPMVGTPAWCRLADDDPRKLAALYDAARHWALGGRRVSKLNAMHRRLFRRRLISMGSPAACCSVLTPSHAVRTFAHRHRDATDATFVLRCWNAAPCTCAAPTKFSVAIITGKRAVALTT
jgi:Protein of unknown function (DUF2742)